MSELSEAAERLSQAIMNIPCQTTEHAYGAYERGHRDARHAAAELVLEHLNAGDDGELVTTEWLRSVGFDVRRGSLGLGGEWVEARRSWTARGTTVIVYPHPTACIIEQGPDESIEVPEYPATRGQFRTLCRALGIELQETRDG